MEIDWENHELRVGFHEWAWSRRTSGMPIYAILSDGKVQKVGETEKRPMRYYLPKETKAIVRVYWTGKGYHTLEVFNKEGNWLIDERENFAIPDELKEIQAPLEELINQLRKFYVEP
jgi:hypothetical protein